MKLLNKKTIEELEKIFADFRWDVKIKFFGKPEQANCRYCRETKDLVETMCGLSPKLHLESFVTDTDTEAMEHYGIKHVPALVVMGEEDHGIRFYGVPGGYEFSSLVESLKLIASGEPMLVQSTRDFLDQLDKDVHLQVFVTPSCPHCPTAVVLAHRMAYYCKHVRADMIEATEFPELAQKYQVMGVPRTIINESGFQEGAVPEDRLVEKIKSELMST